MVGFDHSRAEVDGGQWEERYKFGWEVYSEKLSLDWNGCRVAQGLWVGQIFKCASFLVCACVFFSEWPMATEDLLMQMVCLLLLSTRKPMIYPQPFLLRSFTPVAS